MHSIDIKSALKNPQSEKPSIALVGKNNSTDSSLVFVRRNFDRKLSA